MRLTAISHVPNHLQTNPIPIPKRTCRGKKDIPKPSKNPKDKGNGKPQFRSPEKNPGTENLVERGVGNNKLN